MKKIIISFIVLIVGVVFIAPGAGLLNLLVYKSDNSPVGPNGKNLAEALGYSKNAKLLVVNSDDTCASPTFTHGIEDVMAKGMVTSTSVIVNDRNDNELKRMAQLSKENPSWGVGVHLMLTNEYQSSNPWAPVLPITEVPTLYNDKGLAWSSVAEVINHVDPKQAEMEFVAQIQKAIDSGINVSHIDSHMGTYYQQSQYPNAELQGLTLAAIKAARHFDIPMTLNVYDKALQNSITLADRTGILRPDTFFGIYNLEELNSHLSYSGSDTKKQLVSWAIEHIFGFKLPYKNQTELNKDFPIRKQIYLAAIKGVTKPGLNHFFMHAAAERADAEKIPFSKNHKQSIDHIIRLSDTAIWGDEDLRIALRQENIQLVNYNQIRQIQQQWRKVRQQ